MIKTDLITNPHAHPDMLEEIATVYNKKEHSSSFWKNKLKRIGKGVVNTVQTVLMSKEEISQQIKQAQTDFEQAAHEYHAYRVESGIKVDLSGANANREILTDDPQARPLAERFHTTADIMEGLEKQRFTRRIGRGIVMAAGVIGGVMAAWQFKDAAFLSSAVDQAQLTHGSAADLLPAPDTIVPPEIPSPPPESLSLIHKITAEPGDSYWGIATNLWQQQGIKNPDIGQINDVKNILMQGNPADVHGWLHPGNEVILDTAEAFINNSMMV